MFYIERYLLFIAYPSAVNNAGQSIKGRSEHSNSIESNIPKVHECPIQNCINKKPFECTLRTENERQRMHGNEVRHQKRYTNNKQHK